MNSRQETFTECEYPKCGCRRFGRCGNAIKDELTYATLRTFDTTGTVFRRMGNTLTIICETGEIANRVSDQLRTTPVTEEVQAERKKVAVLYPALFGLVEMLSARPDIRHLLGPAENNIIEDARSVLNPGLDG